MTVRLKSKWHSNQKFLIIEKWKKKKKAKEKFWVKALIKDWVKWLINRDWEWLIIHRIKKIKSLLKLSLSDLKVIKAH